MAESVEPQQHLPVINDLAAELMTATSFGADGPTPSSPSPLETTKGLTVTTVHPHAPQAWSGTAGHAQHATVTAPVPAVAALEGAGSAGAGKGSLWAKPLTAAAAAAAPPRGAGGSVQLTTSAAAVDGTTGPGGGAVAVTVRVGRMGQPAATAAAPPTAATADIGQVLAFTPVVMAFRNVSYFVHPNGGGCPIIHVFIQPVIRSFTGMGWGWRRRAPPLWGPPPLANTRMTLAARW
jgi:hypothetical protein